MGYLYSKMNRVSGLSIMNIVGDQISFRWTEYNELANAITIMWLWLLGNFFRWKTHPLNMKYLYLRFVIRSYIFSTINISGTADPWRTSYSRSTCRYERSYWRYLGMLHCRLQKTISLLSISIIAFTQNVRHQFRAMGITWTNRVWRRFTSPHVIDDTDSIIVRRPPLRSCAIPLRPKDKQ